MLRSNNTSYSEFENDCDLSFLFSIILVIYLLSVYVIFNIYDIRMHRKITVETRNQGIVEHQEGITRTQLLMYIEKFDPDVHKFPDSKELYINNRELCYHTDICNLPTKVKDREEYVSLGDITEEEVNLAIKNYEDRRSRAELYCMIALTPIVIGFFICVLWNNWEYKKMKESEQQH